MRFSFLVLIVCGVCFLAGCQAQSDTAVKDVTLLNVSYDPTRELYAEINAAFEAKWQMEKGGKAAINQSHGGSGKQARSVIDGLDADIVTLALAYDIDQLFEKAGLIPENWQSRLAHNSSPYTSTIVFLVRKGNPRNIQDWDDLVRPGISVITPNPKTSGGARWNYLAAWAYAIKRFGGDEVQAELFIQTLYKNVPVLDAGARGSTTTFVERQIGDVFLSWENEAHLVLKEKEGAYEMIMPSISILAEPPVTFVDKVVKKHGTEEAAKAYLDFLYTPEAQEIIARNFYRPRDPVIAERYRSHFPPIELVTIDESFGGWKKAQDKHFSDGGVYDRIFSV